ncbi:hypothetical protein F9C07_7407 [Aspergillus flavus]|uniref:Uncharacterized protein n=1 Tax=Aspergillus flavus (strain ATCC 200026 / FGSC A1120 / IAM 13836 / NRRL 3357 / JCM 12722 / SRRC 167) TaxID=332952 RepID=A0A7U2QW66_ASPFN|nr:hypothetical protein F9C07_7407 [Aspergillus flavus]
MLYHSVTIFDPRVISLSGWGQISTKDILLCYSTMRSLRLDAMCKHLGIEVED